MWGPTSGTPLLVTSVADFERKFGGVNGATGVVTLSADAPAADPSRHYVRIGAAVGAPARLLWLRSRYPGENADRVSVLLEPHFSQRTKVVTVAARPSGDR